MQQIQRELLLLGLVLQVGGVEVTNDTEQVLPRRTGDPEHLAVRLDVPDADRLNHLPNGPPGAKIVEGVYVVPIRFFKRRAVLESLWLDAELFPNRQQCFNLLAPGQLPEQDGG
jgi:hypothetical protein